MSVSNSAMFALVADLVDQLEEMSERLAEVERRTGDEWLEKIIDLAIQPDAGLVVLDFEKDRG